MHIKIVLPLLHIKFVIFVRKHLYNSIIIWKRRSVLRKDFYVAALIELDATTFGLSSTVTVARVSEIFRFRNKTFEAYPCSRKFSSDQWCAVLRFGALEVKFYEGHF